MISGYGFPHLERQVLRLWRRRGRAMLVAPEAVRRAVRLAVDKGLGEEGLLRVLRRRVGLTGSERMVDLLFQGDGRAVISAIHAAA